VADHVGANLANLAAFADVYLVPRVLADVSACEPVPSHADAIMTAINVAMATVAM
jgi:hypothetical protein